MTSNNKIKRNSFRRTFTKNKISLRRHLNIGANLTAIHSIAQFIHKVLGSLRSFFQTSIHVVFALCMIIGELLATPLKICLKVAAKILSKADKKIISHLDAKRLNGEKLHFHRTSLCAFLAMATILICSASYFGIGIEVTLDGETVGYINSKSDMEKIISDVEQRASGYLGRPYNLSADLSYSLGYVQHDNLLDAEHVKELLFSKVDEVSTQYVLSVDGQMVGANSSKTSLELMKQRILSGRAGTDGATKAEFVQNIAIEQKPVSNSYIKTIEDIEATLLSGTQSAQMYAVQQGDTLGRIAQTYGMTLQQVQGLNPNIDPAYIHVGESIMVSGSSPLVSVKTTKSTQYTQEIAYETELVYSDDLYKNQSKISVNGQNGTASVSAEIISIDGVEQSRVITNWDMVSDPVNEIKLVGTKAAPVKAATGRFIIPFRGLKTSSYGYRSRGFHTGVDFAGVKGSPVVAADGGKVILAGWNGGYGNCVIIDHGNGYTTLYAHNSALKVKQGQQVGKGETIALLGSTGNSTGPHCHWEVRINGKTVNPMNYVG